MRIRRIGSGRRHLISTASVLEVMASGEPEIVRATAPGKRDVLWWVGADSSGEEIEVGAVVSREDPDLLVIIHAMPGRYRSPGPRED